MWSHSPSREHVVKFICVHSGFGAEADRERCSSSELCAPFTDTPRVHFVLKLGQRSGVYVFTESDSFCLNLWGINNLKPFILDIPEPSTWNWKTDAWEDSVSALPLPLPVPVRCCRFFNHIHKWARQAPGDCVYGGLWELFLLQSAQIF